MLLQLTIINEDETKKRSLFLGKHRVAAALIVVDFHAARSIDLDNFC